jgi:hypothetical protein
MWGNLTSRGTSLTGIAPAFEKCDDCYLNIHPNIVSKEVYSGSKADSRRNSSVVGMLLVLSLRG